MKVQSYSIFHYYQLLYSNKKQAFCSNRFESRVEDEHIEKNYEYCKRKKCLSLTMIEDTDGEDKSADYKSV